MVLLDVWCTVPLLALSIVIIIIINRSYAWWCCTLKTFPKPYLHASLLLSCYFLVGICFISVFCAYFQLKLISPHLESKAWGWNWVFPHKPKAYYYQLQFLRLTFKVIFFYLVVYRTTPYVIALVVAKFLHTFGLFVTYEQLKVIHVVQFLFVVRLW